MPAEKTVSKASENRRSNKPLMEKRRRARINQSLTELKSLILDAVKKDNSRHSKLEKADILEMTVKYLQNLQRQQIAAKVAADPDVVNKYRAGFGECTNEVTRFLDGADALETNVRTRLLGHLTTCLSGLDKTAANNALLGPHPASSPSKTSPRSSPSPPSPPPRDPSAAAPSSPAHVDLNNNHPHAAAAAVKRGVLSPTPASIETVFSGLQLIPTRLANGEIAFILPTHHALAAAQALTLGRLEALPSSSSSTPQQHFPSSPSSPLTRSEQLEMEDELPKEEQQLQLHSPVKSESEKLVVAPTNSCSSVGGSSSSSSSESETDSESAFEQTPLSSKTERSDEENDQLTRPCEQSEPLLLPEEGDKLRVEKEEPVWRPW